MTELKYLKDIAKSLDGIYKELRNLIHQTWKKFLVNLYLKIKSRKKVR